MTAKMVKKKTPGFKETARIVEYQKLQDQADMIYDHMDDLWYTMTESELKYLNLSSNKCGSSSSR